ncbi:hypothetical protein SERLA73DRAFT_179422 [Serpula lacrymans var. lacrymans S7.3]|uniref:Ribosomal RNA-processing protein 43 n=2 Tax=Serpula lacrymans var. lacrymans TaxID=341189 RepID=F8PSE6_SERL3|nr:uncharacterized protein SERLADRAFT_464533 [Serpula lacrymans var. lacrymans S7.9]EGO01276.1 hypothetical protein SERLA73DRAFT_179422 [Serpula lacrymans var. lacrymans S7.3]EGO26916.1 hypothetical protein SERLADRAFT_464533 [Serpula lacrymans var. lacrymans S7.9]
MSAGPSAVPDSPAEADSLRAQIFQRLHPRAYLERFLAENVRPDGRAFSEWRDVSLNVGSISTADGSALVRMGDTTVVCGVKAEIAEPELDHPDEGYLVPNLDLPAMCSSKFKPGPPTEEAQVLSDRLNQALVMSGVISLSSLCIHSGRSVWTLYVDATCINYAGNAFDATLLAMVAALKNTRIPQASFDEESGRTVCSRKNRVPLTLSRFPTSASFGIFDASQILADPTAFEEPLLDATVCVVVDEEPELISVNGVGLGITTTVDSQKTIQACISAAKNRSLELQKLL